MVIELTVNLSKRIIKYWDVTAAMVFAAVFSAFCVVIEKAYLLKAIVFCIMVAFILVLWLWYFPKAFRSLLLSVINGRIYLTKGVFFKREYIYPNLQVVYFQAVRLPIAALFGLRLLVLRGAGSSLILPLLLTRQLEEFVLKVTENKV